ncbi:MAG: hypothetical protein IT580_15555 [Verrucomicrobiales bacterium]|nr:hypothetical protein [Verrucomicrobiales bacterium]
MHRSRWLALLWVAWGAVGLLLETAAPAALAPNLKAVRKGFARPTRDYASAPLWVWNDLVTEDQVRSGLRQFAAQEVRQVFIHPRPGLMTPYLGEDWFRLWRVALDEAERLDLNVWIYDENSYPSGFAGGAVMEAMPDAVGLGLQVSEVTAPGRRDADRFRVLAETASGVVDVSDLAEGAAKPEGATRLWEARVLRAKPSAWNGDRPYVNLLTTGVTEKFLELTLGAYDRQVAAQYGKRIPGVFTDEPNIRPAGGLPWCADLPESFTQRWGLKLPEHLPSLAAEIGDWRQVRHHYFATLHELFVERWAKPYYEACEKRGLEFTGHYWDHEWPHTAGVPDSMAMAAWQHRPGIDVLMNQYAEHTHAQFGNVRICREVSSLANQLGRERTLVELYGAGGWDLRFVDMKRIADWLLVLGINTMDEHLSYMTLRGARKRDHPQSFSTHAPWWPGYHVHAAAMTRLCAALSQGRQENRVLVLEPTTTAWMYQGNEPRLKTLGDDFFQLLLRLEAAQVEYDLGCEEVLGREGSVGGAPRSRRSWASAATLRVGRAAYEVVVVPRGTENLEERTWKLLDDFALAGGAVVLCGDPPDRVSGKPRVVPTPRSTLERFWRQIDEAILVAALATNLSPDRVVVRRHEGDAGLLFHHRRVLDDGELLFLVNTSLDHPARGEVETTFAGVERWNPSSGRVEPQASSEVRGGRRVPFELPPAGSLLLAFGREGATLKPAVVKATVADRLPSNTDCLARRLGPNVLTLDHVDLEVAGASHRGIYFYEANRLAWQKHGLPANPWDNAVQFRDERLRRVFPDESGFTLTYRFEMAGPIPPDLEIVIERSDLYAVECNGKPVAWAPDSFWLDRAFHRIPIAGVAKPGENEVVLRARPMTMWHEIEPAYLLGTFGLEAAPRGWRVVADRALSVQADQGWDRQGNPFYGDRVAYRQEFTLRRREGTYVVRLPKWEGSVARVDVNGAEAGWITAPPWECDVTDRLKRGDNRVEVIVYGTLRNPLGPHHNGPALGSAWPGMFQKAPVGGLPPGEAYSTVGYGLFAPFELENRRVPETK